MKSRGLLLILAVLNISCATQRLRPVSPDSFLKMTYDTRNFLKRSLSLVPEGAYLKTDAEGVRVLDVNWPGDAFITCVEENQPWKSHAHYNFVLDLGETDLFKYSQNDSYTMTAAILLDHYFSGLEGLGFRQAGEPQTRLFYPVQFISNTWFKTNCNITVVGSIYINIEDRKALVAADISEIYSPGIY